MIKVSDLFNVEYGTSLELNALTNDPNGINFISRTSKNNGVSAKVKPLKDIKPILPGTITVAAAGSVMESFLQNEPYYTSYHVFVLTPKIPLTELQLLYYCLCLRTNKYRYNYGRQANRTLRDILIPSVDEIPTWINDININHYLNANKNITSDVLTLEVDKWEWFEIQELFELRKGKRLTKANMVPGAIPFIGSISINNGLSNCIGQKAIHDGNTITVTYNGSIAEAFYQPIPFWASDDVNVLYPRFNLNPYIALFICTIIRQEKYRFNYGRKWHMERMNTSRIKLPVTSKDNPDWGFMERYIEALPFSNQI